MTKTEQYVATKERNDALMRALSRSWIEMGLVRDPQTKATTGISAEIRSGDPLPKGPDMEHLMAHLIEALKLGRPAALALAARRLSEETEHLRAAAREELKSIMA